MFDGAGPLSSAIGHGSTISPGADVVRSALMSDVFIGDNSSIIECLIGEGAKIGAGVKLESVVVDYGAEIPEGYSQVGGTFPES